MKNYLLLKYFIALFREYIIIILTATVFLFIQSTKSFSEENVFTIGNVVVKGVVDLNFSREKYINKAFINSFEILMTRVLLSKDLKVISNIKLKKIKTLINSFQILEESYQKNQYTVTFKITYNDMKVKRFLGQKNISFSQPKNISAIFFPVLFINDEIIDFNENYFYKKWNTIMINNESINFVMPLEDLDDISRIKEIKNKMDEINVDNFVNKYNLKNYTFALMDYENKKLDIYLKTKFNNNYRSKNFSYEIDNIDDEKSLNVILKDLKMKITDIWKEANVVNLLMPLSIRIKFNHKNLMDLDNLKKTFAQINIIDNYLLEEFNFDNSFFKIYYFGNPKKLKTELFKFGYQLDNDKGYWEILY